MEHLTKKLGFDPKNLSYLPISGLTGENLLTRSKEAKLVEWYDGPCLVEVLNQLKVPQRAFTKPLRITISEYEHKGSGDLIGDCVQAKVEAGLLLERQ